MFLFVSYLVCERDLSVSRRHVKGISVCERDLCMRGFSVCGFGICVTQDLCYYCRSIISWAMSVHESEVSPRCEFGSKCGLSLELSWI